MSDSDHKLPPLDDELNALLGEARQESAEGPPAGTRERLYGRLALTLGLPTPGPSPDAGPAPDGAPPPPTQPPPAAPSAPPGAAATGAAGAGASALGGKTLVLTLAGLATAGAVVATTLVLTIDGPPPTPTRAPQRAGTATSNPPAAEPGPPAAEPAPPAAEPNTVAPAPKKRARRRPARRRRRRPRRVRRPQQPPSAPSRPSSTLAAEQALLERARSALRAGKPAAAMQRLRQHRARFPGGQLVEERAALVIRALVALGKIDQARARARRFARRYPRSIFLPAVRTTLRRAARGSKP